MPRNEEGRAGTNGDRTHGVGSAPAGPGSGSGGDLDPDFVGIAGNAGLAQEPPAARGSNAPDDRDAPSGDSNRD